MITKIFEIRDRGTYIPVLATKLDGENFIEDFHIHGAGIGVNCKCAPIFIAKLSNPTDAHYDPYGWNDPRTMLTAHKHIADNFDNLVNCEVIDVEFILGETTTTKLSEVFNRGNCI